MEEPPRPQNELLVALRKHCALIKVNGRGTFKAGPSLKRFGVSAIEKGCTRIILDMEDCLGMDSTFMGVLAGLALRLQRDVEGSVIVMNLTTKTASLLRTLGLDRLVECYEEENIPDSFRSCLADMLDLKDLSMEGDNDRISLITMLEAHQDLVELDPDNLSRFRDVISYLDQDLKNMDG
jgi:anti-sigma B factor antagonist